MAIVGAFVRARSSVTVVGRRAATSAAGAFWKTKAAALRGFLVRDEATDPPVGATRGVPQVAILFADAKTIAHRGPAAPPTESATIGIVRTKRYARADGIGRGPAAAVSDITVRRIGALGAPAPGRIKAPTHGAKFDSEHEIVVVAHGSVRASRVPLDVAVLNKHHRIDGGAIRCSVGRIRRGTTSGQQVQSGDEAGS